MGFLFIFLLLLGPVSGPALQSSVDIRVDWDMDMLTLGGFMRRSGHKINCICITNLAMKSVLRQNRYPS
jgi:hypothetical protein